MDTKKHIYKLVGVISAIIYLAIIILAIFEATDFKFLDIAIKILAIFFTPAIYLIFAGLGEIIDYIERKEVYNISSEIKQEEEEIEPVQLEIPLDEKKDDEPPDTDTNNDANEDDKEEVDKDIENVNDDSTEDDTEQEENYEPEIKNGKIRCRYCGKYNKVKRTYCYLCAKKLKD